MVGESTEVFPASKATMLESSNKSLARPHQSSASTGSGKGEGPHHRPRRDVDGHASSSTSVLSSDTTASVDTHELVTPYVNTLSLVHGVSSPEVFTESAERDDSANALVSSDVGASNNIGVTNIQTPSLISDGLVTEPTTVDIPNEQINEITTKKLSEIVENQTDVTSEVVQSQTDVSEFPEGIENIDEDSLSKVIQSKEIISETSKSNPSERPVESELPYENAPLKKDNSVAYEPSEMQNDAFPNMFSYGIQKLHYTQLMSKFKAMNQMIHLLTNETETDRDLEKFHYDREISAATHISTLPNPLTTTSNVATKIITTNEPTEQTEILFTTTHAPDAIVSTINPPSVTYSNISETITTETHSQEEGITEHITIEPKTPDLTSNPKHVLINLTISADDNENSYYKPLYSLTVTVPTAVGDGKEIPTVKITPIDIEPTLPTNFNEPIAMKGTESKQSSTNSNLVGSCECSCPSCDGSDSPEDNYDELFGTLSSKSDEEIFIDSTTESSITDILIDNETVTTENYSDSYETSSDMLTTIIDSTAEADSELFSTTEKAAIAKCVCPKVVPPPILILEGEVLTLSLNNKLTTHKKHCQRVSVPITNVYTNQSYACSAVKIK